MKRTESKYNTTLNQYLRQAKLYCYYELKVASGGTFNFKKIEENQDEGLPALANDGLVWKLSDEDSRKKPCDGLCTPPLPAFLIIVFNRTFYFIEYSIITKMKNEGRKSITEKEAENLSTKILHVNN